MSNASDCSLSNNDCHIHNNDANDYVNDIHNCLHDGPGCEPTKSPCTSTGDVGHILPDARTEKCNTNDNVFVLSRRDTGLECIGNTGHADTAKSATNEHAVAEPHDGNVKNKNAHYYRNREKILAYAKIRYRENREKLLAYSKQYQSERKDRVKERNDEYYAKNKEALLKKRGEKITCECGKIITRGSLSGHIKTKYHLKHVQKNEEETKKED